MTEGDRREVLGAGAAMGLGVLLPTGAGAGAGATPTLDPMPPMPAKPTPGRPGDFAFLSGEWRVDNWRLKSPGVWDRFEGEATVYGILAGIGSVEELRIPARDFSGMGLRLLDVEKRVWSDHWVNARSGVVGVPGQPGSFENGAGVFVSDDEEAGQPVKYAGVWDQITPAGCRWRQAASRDGGASWEQSWIMHWRRAG